MLLSLLPLAGWAQMSLTSGSEQTIGNIKYKVLTVYQTEDFENNKVNTVSAQQNNFTGTDLVVPAEVTFDVKGTSTDSKAIDGNFTFKVIQIANTSAEVGFKANSNIKTVTIGSNGKTYVQIIDANAFDGSSNIESVTFLPYTKYQKNAGTQTFGADIFKGCNKIKTLDLSPTTLATIENYFATEYTTPVANSTLESVTLPATWTALQTGAFQNCTKLGTVTFTAPIANLGEQTVKGNAFLGCPIANLDLTNTNIKSIPTTILVDGTNVVYNTKTAKVVMPATLETIEAKAFNGCVGLSDVDFSKAANLSKIGDFAFGTTPSLTKIDLSGATKLVAFSTSGYQTPFIPAADKKNTELTWIILPTSKKIGSTTYKFETPGTALANLPVLNKLEGLSLVTTIADGAFTNDAALTELSFPNTLTTVTGSPFAGCTSLTKLTFDGKVLTALGDATNKLYGTTDVLEELYITGATAVDIKKAAFADLTKLTTVEIAKGKNFTGKIGDDAVAITIAENGALVLGNLATGATLNDGAFAVGDGTNVTIGNIAALTMTASAIDGDVAKLVIGNISADLSSAAAAIVNGAVDELEVGAISGAVKLELFGQAAKITFKGNITAAISAPTTANAALTEVDFGSVQINADLIGAAAFDENNASNLVKVTWKPADNKAVAAFDVKAFGTASKGAAAAVSLYTTQKVADDCYSRDEVNKLYNVKFIAEVATKDIALENNGTGTYYYAKFFGAGEYKIAKANEDGKKFIVYGAYVDASDNTVYMEQLHIINGYYYIPANVPVIVKGEAAATKALSAAGESKSSMNMVSATNYVSEIAYLEGETVGTALMNLTTDKNWNLVTPSADVNNTNFNLYALAKISKYNITWKAFGAATTLPEGTFYVRKAKAVGAPEMLNLIWTDGSEESTTGIENVNAEQQFNGDIFNLQGIRVSEPIKGQIYIQNGKKFMMK